uniref:Uncharacterized protein n=1 Tax=Avena sativa TaxID=4498 RepID=A0ACD5TEA8_AVESA
MTRRFHISHGWLFSDTRVEKKPEREEAKDFLARCLIREPTERCTAAQLLEHPFLASTVVDVKSLTVERKWVSPKSTLDAAFWESESDADEADEELSHSSTAERIKSLVCPGSALPDWDSDEGWIDVLSAPTEPSDDVAVPAKEMADLDDAITGEEQIAEPGVLDITVDNSVLSVGEAGGDSFWPNSRHRFLESLVCHVNYDRFATEALMK